MLVEPIGEDHDVLLDACPAVDRSRFADELHRGLHPDHLASLQEDLRLVDRHELIGVPVDDERRRHVRPDEVDRRDLLAEDGPAFRRVAASAERRLEAGQDSDAHGVVSRAAPVQKIGRREEARHRLHRA